MFKRVVLDNFKSFCHLDVDFTGSKDIPHDYVAVFGRNGSGKTNLIQAFQFLIDSTKTLEHPYPHEDSFKGTIMLEEGFENCDEETVDLIGKFAKLVGENTRERLFSLNTSRLVGESKMLGAKGNMRMEFTFVLNGADAVYSMEFGENDRIVYENLDCRIGNRKGSIFTISRDENKQISTRYHKSFFVEKEGLPALWDAISNDWGPHTLLSILRRERDSIESMVCNEVYDALDHFDDVRICLRGRKGMTFDLESGIIRSDKRKMLEAYESAISKFFIRTSLDIRNVHYDVYEDGGRIHYQLYFEKRINGEFQDVKSSHESLGTRNLLRLLPYLMELSRGKTVLIDEIDTGIHVELMYLILEEILGSGNGQLIMTTHNTRLLLKLDPKKAYVINQHYNDAKTITPISSIARTQKNNNNEDRYHNGVFGDIPHTSLIDMEEISGTFDEFMGDP
ncbi:MAG: ATP-binding protein [Thermoplasmata archaeon]|nr:ATP-binding protein [Thermoplasmata archaeon]